METFQQLAVWLVECVNQLGYAGIFILSFVESTFVPVPSEMTMIPAGYLVHQGKMLFLPTLLISIVGTLSGSYCNYWIAKRYGRGLFLRYGRYFFMTPEKLEYLERFFATHGSISIFTGRLIPGVRHCISFPAGLARMRLQPFFLYTTIGATIWMSVLLGLGYAIGEHKDMVMQYLPRAKMGLLVIVFIGIIIYALWPQKTKKGEA